MSCVSPFWLLFCVCCYVLGRSVTSPILGRVTLCGWCTVGLSSSFLNHLRLALQKYPFCGLYMPCYSWALIAVGTSVCVIDPQADCLWGLATSTAHETEQNSFAPVGFGAWPDYPLGVPLVKLIGWCSVVVWSQSQGVLVWGVLRDWALVQVNVRLCCDQSGYLFGATKQSLLGSRLCQVWMCVGKAKLWT